MHAQIHRHCISVNFLFLTLLWGNPLWAFDTEIFFSRASDDATQPNVLFVFDGSGSMNWYDCADGTVRSSSCNDGTANGTTTRLSRLKTSLTEVLNNTSNINVGLMRFSHTESGGRVLYPIRPIDQQFCSGEPCGDDTVFTAQSRTSSSEDDAIELFNNEVKLDQPVISLTSDTSTTDENAWIGLRFPNLQIPQGATITDARLHFTSMGNSEKITNLVFHALDTENATPYTPKNYSVSGRNRTYNSVSWNNVPKWVSESVYESPDLSTLIQQIVRKPGWCGGNALGITINGAGDRLAAAFESGASNSPSLTVSYKLKDIPATGGCTKTTVLATVASNSDDASQRTRSKKSKRVGRVNRWRWENIVSNPSNNKLDAYISAIRFTNVQIPKGAKIVNATIALTTRKLDWHNVSYYPGIDIYAQNTTYPATISGNRYNITDRNITSTVYWPDANIDTNHNATSISPTVASIIQPIVNQRSWKTGNPLLFVLKPAGPGGYTFFSRDANKSKAPLLKIEYETKILTARDKINGPVTDVRSEIIEEMDSMVAYHGTPTVGALLEARNYFSGGPVDYGKTRSIYHDSSYSADPYYWGRYSRVSTPDSFTGGTISRSPYCTDNSLDGIYCATERVTGSPHYTSPFTHECQSNHIVLLTDGAPTADTSAISKVEALTGTTCANQFNDEGTCGEEIAKYMTENDQHSFAGNQFITTHTIGFNFTTQWLKDVATAGGGNFYTADSAGQLSTALANIISSVQDETSTFVAPGATVDHFSRISHRNDIYLALFQPKANPRWIGNLKRYDFSGNPARLHDADGNPAVDPKTGYFKDGSRSFWSSTADNNQVNAGGAAGKLLPGARNIYTYTGTSTDLTSASNKFDKDNTAITSDDLGLASSDSQSRNRLLDWARGYDIQDENSNSLTTDSRFHIGDPLHSKPAIVTYGGTSSAPESVIYFGTNEGFLHAINTSTGDEIFSFIPTELLPNLKPQFDNIPGSEKVYGLDGAISVWKQDKNLNGSIDGDDKVYVYAGMRRGGTSYYALDVTDKNQPEFKWQIIGGPGGTVGFEEMGETWSQPVVTDIRFGINKKRKVLIFGGGYDNSQDDKLTRTEDSVGRALYIVDAETGDLLWSGGAGGGNKSKIFDEMVYSVPATPKAIDVDGDGASEQIYVGDMGGRIWRFDIISSSDDLEIDGGIIADFGNDAVMSDARRFYHTPDISLSTDNAGFLINLAIGSGYQAHPLNTVIEDRFYLLRYPYKYAGEGKYGIPRRINKWLSLFGINEQYRPISEIDLYDATDNLIGEGTAEEIESARQELATAKGWFIKMQDSGEKVLGPSITFNNKVMFASYLPGQSSSGCSPHIGSGVFWAVNLWDATPAENFDDENVLLDKTDRKKKIPGAGLPPPPQTLILQTSDTDDEGIVTENDIQIITVSGGNTLMKHHVDSLLKRVYWSETPEY